jgi:hypothetical protein
MPNRPAFLLSGVQRVPGSRSDGVSSADKRVCQSRISIPRARSISRAAFRDSAFANLCLPKT